MERHLYAAERQESLLLIIDVQQAMLKVMNGWQPIAAKIRQLTAAAGQLGVPILLTEQYAKGLGGTIAEVLEGIEAPRVFHKEHFSACLEPDFLLTVRAYQRPKIVVVGMETHVCVLQTCLDLIQAGFQLHLVADAVGSRAVENRDRAIGILRDAGAIISTTEIVIFQWARRANTDEFRRILPIVK
ncbi:isochorismatase family protein [Desulfatitalea alkaliphila]|uniref:Isochorismatase family protein n=1 Tax=Desulfatitalea alkaliphila TaxID=2929485 RepID=A0AA41UM59_9BACT|nr:isochorismatase family protein [Desulfatitalea alkaliphila]MCJ8503097.1 isochorismatase family protein [Desulfatitalea alkaliphila]